MPTENQNSIGCRGPEDLDVEIIEVKTKIGHLQADMCHCGFREEGGLCDDCLKIHDLLVEKWKLELAKLIQNEGDGND